MNSLTKTLTVGLAAITLALGVATTPAAAFCYGGYSGYHCVHRFWGGYRSCPIGMHRGYEGRRCWLNR